jgi:rhodanese-related sulfurtransferase
MADDCRAHRGLAATAAVLALLALGADDPYPGDKRQPLPGDSLFVTAVEVARLVRDGRADVRIVDLRVDSLFDSYHVPGAERIGRANPASERWSPDDRLILYAEDDARAIAAARTVVAQGAKHVRVLRGGLITWVEQIVQPRLATLPPTATPHEQAARREQLDLSRYFGGTPYVSPDVTQPDAASEAAAVARILRRGC